MTITVALPDAAILHRLQPAPTGVHFVVWDVADEPAAFPIDLLVLRYMIPAADLARLAAVRVGVVQSQTLGYDGVRDALPPGTVYCNAVDVHEASTGELTLALVLASLRGIPAAAVDQRDGRWAHAQHPGLAGKTVLLVGVGGVGREIEGRLAPFDVTLLRVARTARTDERGVVHGFDRLPELLGEADVVILAVPLTDDTRHLVDAPFLEATKPGALIVNVSRGPVVDTQALVAALEAGRVTAALDVTDPEPLPADHPLWRAPGVLITPHLGGHTDAMSGRVDRLVREQIRRLLAGEPPKNLIFS
ncbi:MAG: 2-hydroxyacid dehydrogenase [Rhodoglobus sp.]